MDEIILIKIFTQFFSFPLPSFLQPYSFSITSFLHLFFLSFLSTAVRQLWGTLGGIDFSISLHRYIYFILMNMPINLNRLQYKSLQFDLLNLALHSSIKIFKFFSSLPSAFRYLQHLTRPLLVSSHHSSFINFHVTGNCTSLLFSTLLNSWPPLFRISNNK